MLVSTLFRAICLEADRINRSTVTLFELYGKVRGLSIIKLFMISLYDYEESL